MVNIAQKYKIIFELSWVYALRYVSYLPYA
jgi:hypothetical protein